MGNFIGLVKVKDISEQEREKKTDRAKLRFHREQKEDEDIAASIERPRDSKT